MESLLREIKKIKSRDILLAFAIAMLALLPEVYLSVGVLLFLFAIAKANKGIKPFFFLFMLLLFIVPYNLSPTIRLILQILTFITFIYLFFQDYGLQVSSYPQIPKYIGSYFVSLFLVMILSTLHSEYRFLGISQIVRTFQFFILVYLIYSIVCSYKEITGLIYVMFISAIVYTSVLFLQFAMAGFSLISLNAEAFYQNKIVYMHANNLGGFFLITISLILTILFGGGNKRRIKYILIVLLFILSAGLFLSNSRAAILSMFISLCYILYKLNRKALVRIFVAAASTLFLMLFNPFNEMIDAYFRVSNLVSGRDFLLEAVKPVIRNNPILGAGPAATKYYLYKEMPYLMGSRAETLIHEQSVRIEFGQAHNFYLFFFSDMGIFGFLLSLSLPVLVLYYCIRAQKGIKYLDWRLYLISVGITGAAIGFFIRGFFEWGGLLSYGTIQLDLPFWVMIVIILYIVKICENHPNNNNLIKPI